MLSFPAPFAGIGVNSKKPRKASANKAEAVAVFEFKNVR